MAKMTSPESAVCKGRERVWRITTKPSANITTRVAVTPLWATAVSGRVSAMEPRATNRDEREKGGATAASCWRSKPEKS